MKPFYSLFLLPLGICAFLLSACKPAGDPNGEAVELVRPAIYHEVAVSSGTVKRSFAARVDASDMRELFFSIPGVVNEVPVRQSDEVSEGQLLAALDSRDYQSALDAATARLENAVEELERAERLFKEDAIAESVLDQRRAAQEVAQAEFDAAEKALSDTRIVAPFDGVVSRVSVEESATVAAGTTAVRVFSKDRLEATIAVPASLIVKADGTPETDRKATVRLDADADTVIEATFKEAVLEADESSQSYAVTFEFKSPEDLIVLPGMSATVELQIGGRNTASGVVVPMRAVLAEGEGRFVWVVDTASEPNRVSRREVQIGSALGEELPVESGLVPGEVIVAAGVSDLAEGMAVRSWSRSSN